MTPLRQQFIDDLRLRNFSAGTIKAYVHAVERFARYVNRSPADATIEDVRNFLVGEIDRGMPRSYPDDLNTLLGFASLDNLTIDEHLFDLYADELNAWDAVAGNTVLVVALADLNRDGAVDAADVDIMFGNWGSPGTGDSQSQSVPEPTNAAVLIRCLLGLLSAWRPA